MAVEVSGILVREDGVYCGPLPGCWEVGPRSKARGQRSRGVHDLLAYPGPIARPRSAASKGLENGAPASPSRYAEQAKDLPAAAQRPGAGAKVKLIDPDWLAEKILNACRRRRAELVVPAKARWLFALATLETTPRHFVPRALVQELAWRVPGAR